MTVVTTMAPVRPTTLGEALESATKRLRASGSPTPRLDAEVLLAFVLGTHRTAVLAHPDAPLGNDAAERLRTCVTRREVGEPVAYIRGLKEFHGLTFSVDARVLIPRPETELLVDLGQERIAAALTSAPCSAGAPPLRVVDVGTGSGAVVVALGSALRKRGLLEAVDLLGTDISRDALAVAAENAVAHGIADHVRFIEADLLPPGPDAAPFDLLLANLPYVRSPDVPGLPVAATFEPVIALDGGPDGLVQLRRLLDRAPAMLAATGVALLEIGGDQAEAAFAEAAGRVPGRPLVLHRDLAGLPRVVEIGPAEPISIVPGDTGVAGAGVGAAGLES
jgi:release factor glutamine methyltransferase